MTVSSRTSLPVHAARFRPNMTFGVVGGGFGTTLNIANYFSDALFAAGYASAAVLELTVYDAEGRRMLDDRSSIPVNGSTHVDVGDRLCATEMSERLMVSIYARLIPVELPDDLGDGLISTEYTSEIRTPGGHRSFFHNTLGPTQLPSVGRIESGQLFCDPATEPQALVLCNNYLGPAIPGISTGRAQVHIRNERGKVVVARSASVPRRGIRMFFFRQEFPELTTFLDDRPGTLRLTTCNLLRKPWVWFVAPDDPSSVSIEHL